MRIGIVGSTGVGKSTVTKELANRLGFKEITEPIPDTLKVFLQSIGTKDEFFWRSIHDMNILSCYRDSHYDRVQPNVVIERPIGENAYIFGTNMVEDFLDLARKQPLELIVYLYSEPKTILNRIRKRARSGEEVYDLDWVIQHCNKYWSSIHKIAEAHNNPRVIHIDTTDKTINDIIDNIVWLI